MQDVNKIQSDGTRLIFTLNDGKKYTANVVLEQVNTSLAPISAATASPEPTRQFLVMWKVEEDKRSGVFMVEEGASNLHKFSEEKRFRDIIYYENAFMSKEQKAKDYKSYYDFEEKCITYETIEGVEVMKINPKNKFMGSYVVVELAKTSPYIVAKVALEL